jgi:hypothetical protein
MSPEIRAVIHFVWLKDVRNAEISRETEAVDGEGVTWRRAIQKWTRRFEDGDHSLEDAPMTRRPRSTEHVKAIRVLLADDLYLSEKRLFFIANIHQGTVKHILREGLSLREVNFPSSGWR